LTVKETYDTIIEIVLAGAEALLKRATPLLCELAILTEKTKLQVTLQGIGDGGFKDPSPLDPELTTRLGKWQVKS
jgi:hypothetical protein